MKCPKCNKVYSEENVFCVDCGTRLIDDDIELRLDVNKNGMTHTFSNWFLRGDRSPALIPYGKLRRKVLRNHAYQHLS